MRKHLISVALVLLLVIAPLSSSSSGPQGVDDPVLAKIIEIGRTDNQTTVWLDYLTNRFGTRISGTDAYANAAEWALRQFRSWGLQAELQEAGEVAVGFSHGPSYGKIVGPPDTYLYFGTPGYSAGTKGRVRGPVVVAPAGTAAVEAMKGRFKGTWVLASAPTELTTARQRGERAPIYKLLQEAGALGAIFRGAAMPWRLSRNPVPSWEQLPTMPEITLLDAQYDQIKGLADAGKTVTLEFEIRNFFKPGPVKYHNVVAWLPGVEFSEESVILSGHLDTVAGSAGATDCGSGVTPAMEAIRILAKAGARPRRTVMTHLFAAEELGILGAQAWLKQHPDRVPKIAVMMNRDYNPGAIIGATVPRSWHADFERVTRPLIGLNAEFPFTLNVSPYPATKSVRPGGTDASVFSMQGVPTLRFAEKTEHVYNSTYHTVWDTFDDALPWAKHQEHTALALAVMAYGIANLDHQLPREDFYLPDGLYADITTARGRIIASLDYEHAPETVKAFVGLFEQPQAAPGAAPASPRAGGRGAGAGQPLPSLGTFDVVDPKTAAAATVTAKDMVARAVKMLPKEKNAAIAHDRAGVIGMQSPTRFYITSAKAKSYDKKHVAIGTVLADMAVVGKLVKGDAINRVVIVRVGPKATAFGRSATPPTS
jgi:cyclophilin family peptidyl-prolyl cis-trans isomerase